MDTTIWIPTVKAGLHQLKGDFSLLRYGQKEGGGAAYVVGPIISVEKREMAKNGLSIILNALRYYKWWPADTHFKPELMTMGSAKRSRFINNHRFISIDQINESTLSIEPQHRLGGGWRGITGYASEQKRVRPPITQEDFYRQLILAFDRAT